MPELVYADHHATTPLDPEVLEAMQPWLSGLAANPSSVHGPGRAARKAVEEARAKVARALSAQDAEIVLTSGGTESDNLGVWGGARAARKAAPERVFVAATATEHPAVRESARALVADGFSYLEVEVDLDGLPREGAFEAALEDRERPLAVASAILANNETGAVNGEVSRLAALARRQGVVFHTDAVQAIGKIRVDVRELGVDLLSLTAHKFGGPKGAGALFVRKGTALSPILTGGSHEKGRRAGTENVPAIVGLGAAIEKATRLHESEASRVGALRDAFEARILAAIPNARRNGCRLSGTRRLPTVSSLAFPGLEAETLLVALDLEGVAASSGSACTAGTTTPSRVLLACGLAEDEVLSTLRFSFGRTTTEADIERLVDLLPRLASRVRALAA